MCNHHGRPGWRRGRKYCLSGMPVKGLLHLAILKVISGRPMYGSEIQRVLREKYGIEVPRAMIYGLLQKLEESGFLISTWDTSGSGPARRVYRITEEGEEYLRNTVSRLAEVRDMIDRLISG